MQGVFNKHVILFGEWERRREGVSRTAAGNYDQNVNGVLDGVLMSC